MTFKFDPEFVRSMRRFYSNNYVFWYLIFICLIIISAAFTSTNNQKPNKQDGICIFLIIFSSFGLAFVTIVCAVHMTDDWNKAEVAEDKKAVVDYLTRSDRGKKMESMIFRDSLNNELAEVFFKYDTKSNTWAIGIDLKLEMMSFPTTLSFRDSENTLYEGELDFDDKYDGEGIKLIFKEGISSTTLLEMLAFDVKS